MYNLAHVFYDRKLGLILFFCFRALDYTMFNKLWAFFPYKWSGLWRT